LQRHHILALLLLSVSLKAFNQRLDEAHLSLFELANYLIHLLDELEQFRVGSDDPLQLLKLKLLHLAVLDYQNGKQIHQEVILNIGSFTF
jgi:hemerythrin